MTSTDLAPAHRSTNCPENMVMSALFTAPGIVRSPHRRKSSVTTTAVIEAQYRVLQALETAIYGLGSRTPLPVELTQTADPQTVSETIDLRQGRRRLVPLGAEHHVHANHGGPPPPS